MPVTLEQLRVRASSMGLYIQSGKNGMYRFYTEPNQNWFADQHMSSVKGKNQVEAFLDGFLLGQQGHGRSNGDLRTYEESN